MKMHTQLSFTTLFVILSILYTAIADSCNNSSCDSVKMPLLSNNLKAPLFADFDVSTLNEQLKDYIDQNIISTFTKQVESMVNKTQSDMKTYMLKEYSSKLEKSDILHGETFSRMFNEFEQRFFNLSEKQNENATNLMTDVQEWKTTLMHSMKQHSEKLQKSEIAYENKLSEVLKNYNNRFAQISEEATKRQSDWKTYMLNMLKKYSSNLEKSETKHGETLSRMFNEFEQRFFNLSEKQSENATKLMTDVKEWKMTLTHSIKEHSGKLQKSEIAYDNKLSEVLKNYNDKFAQTSEEATKNFSDIKTNIKEWKNKMVTDLVKSITANITQFSTETNKWKNSLTESLSDILLPMIGKKQCIGIDKIYWENNGLYDDSSIFSKFCNYDVDGVGWIVIQRRQDDLTDFYRTWSDYNNGFGSLNGSFWLGNDNIHKLTSSGRYELRVDLSDWQGGTWYAMYKTFKVENESSKYKLTVGGYSGTAGDSLKYHNGSKFSAKDQDNDSYANECAKEAKGGWWYSGCHKSNLNGIYKKGKSDYWNVVSWRGTKGDTYSLKFVRMMIRRY